MTQFSQTNFRSMIPELPAVPHIPMPQPLKGAVSLGGPQFKDVVADLLGKVNSSMDKSEKLAENSVTTGKVNLHEIMIAMAEEEIALGLTTQVAGKFISTVEKLTQIQV